MPSHVFCALAMHAHVLTCSWTCTYSLDLYRSVVYLSLPCEPSLLAARVRPPSLSIGNGDAPPRDADGDDTISRRHTCLYTEDLYA